MYVIVYDLVLSLFYIGVRTAGVYVACISMWLKGLKKGRCCSNSKLSARHPVLGRLLIST